MTTSPSLISFRERRPREVILSWATTTLRLPLQRKKKTLRQPWIILNCWKRHSFLGIQCLWIYGGSLRETYRLVLPRMISRFSKGLSELMLSGHVWIHKYPGATNGLLICKNSWVCHALLRFLQSLTSNFFNRLKHIKLGRVHLWCFGIRVPTNNKNIQVICHWWMCPVIYWSWYRKAWRLLLLLMSLTYPWIDVWMMPMLPLIFVQFLKDSMFVALIDRVWVRSPVPSPLHTVNN